MKTTIDLPDDLMIEAKKRAVELRRPFRELVIEALRARLGLSRQENNQQPRVIRWIVHDGGLPPSVDLKDRTRMSEWLRSHP